MKITRVETRPAHTIEKQIGLCCDLCKKNYTERSTFWDVEETEISITIQAKKGNHWSDGTGCRGEKWEVDLCPSCFMQRLIPWLKSQGCTINQKGWDW